MPGAIVGSQSVLGEGHFYLKKDGSICRLSECWAERQRSLQGRGHRGVVPEGCGTAFAAGSRE